MFDLGLTLIDADRRPFPNAREALATIAGLKAGGKPLRSCLISDFTMPTPPVTKAKINALFEEYLGVLGGAGLRSFFEPVAKRVTLSTHAGVNKPHRAIFETALRTAGREGAARINACSSRRNPHTSRPRGRLSACRHCSSGRLDKRNLISRTGPNCLLLVAGLVNPHRSTNTKAAIKAQLSAQGVNADSVEPVRDGVARIAGTTWHAISVPGFDDLRDVQVAIPVEGEVTYESRRRGAGSRNTPALFRYD